MTLFVYDFDGSLSPSGESCVEVLNLVLENNGFEPITWQTYREQSVMEGWIPFLGAFGVPEDRALAMGEEYQELRGTIHHPGFGKEQLAHFRRIEEKVGKENLLILTNEAEDHVHQRSAGQIDLERRVITASGAKSKEMLALYNSSQQEPIVYFGDTVGDEIACANARAEGARITYVALATPIAFNTENRLIKHAATTNYASYVRNLKEIEKHLG